MKRRIIFYLVVAFVLILVLIPRSDQVEGQSLFAPISTAFTYQGKLMDGGAPATGVFDLTFTLYDALSAGSQVGSTVILEDVVVADGLFTVQLDFGAVFDGAALYLEIGVRPGSGGAFVTLAPRQELTAAPYARYAEQAPWSGLTNIPAGFADGTDDGQAYNAGTGLSLNSGTFGISDTFQLPQTCSNGQITQWNGTEWECASQNAYTAGTGLNLASGQMSLLGPYQLPQACANGQLPQWNGSAWLCTNQTTYTAGTGLSLTSGQMSISGSYQLPQSCGIGQISQWNGAAWICGNDSGATYTAGSGIGISSNTISATYGGSGSSYGTADSVARSDHTHSNYLASGAAAGGDLTGTYPNPTIANNAVGSAEIADGSVNMADTVNWMGNGVASGSFSSGSTLTLLDTGAFTPSSTGECLVIINAAITSTGDATAGLPPVLRTVIARNGTTSADTSTSISFSPGDVTSNQPIGASASYVWDVANSYSVQFGCQITDPDGASADWGSDETATCRISYICQ